MGFTPDTVNLVVALFHIGGTGVTYIGFAHARHNIMRNFEPQRVVEAIQGHGVSSMFMVPAMIQAIVKLVPNVRDYDFSSLEIIAWGLSHQCLPAGEAMSVFGCRFSQVYGMTETSGTVVALAPEDHVRAVAEAPHLLTSCGKPCLERVR